MDNRIKEFVSHAIFDMLNNKVDITIRNSSYLKYSSGINNVSVSGWFSESDSLEFACAVGKSQKNWIQTFVHEYCHFQQWKEKESTYTRWDDETDLLVKYDEWLEGREELTKKELIKATRVIQACELNCEKRSVKMIKEWDLPINIDDYIKKANCYIYFYNAVSKYRNWYKKAPYNVSKINKLVPNTFQKSYVKSPEGFDELCNELCLDKRRKKNEKYRKNSKRNFCKKSH